jgi:serine/threonine protein kinase
MFIGGACEPGNAFLISEFAKLGSLDSYIANNRGKLSFPQRIQFAIEAAKGMCFLHNNNRVHRDLKSLNLLVTIMDKQTVVKVADFGESRTAQENMTIAAGTYNWMAPEVLTSRTYTQKADVFSFGIILWELLTTTLPERNPQDVAEGRIPPIPPEYEEKYPEYVALIRSCCRQNPNKRPSFQTLVIKLKQCKKKYQALMKN